MKGRDLNPGDWFKYAQYHGEKCMLLSPACNTLFLAVSLVTGVPLFMRNDGWSQDLFADIDVVLLDKPSQIKPFLSTTVEWRRRYDSPEQRSGVEGQIQQLFPDVQLQHEDHPGTWFLITDVSPEIHKRLKNAFGG